MNALIIAVGKINYWLVIMTGKKQWQLWNTERRIGALTTAFLLSISQAEAGECALSLTRSTRAGGDIPQLPYQSFDEDGRRYVTWRSKLDNLGDAKTVAELWAELVHGYQRDQEEHGLYVELIKRYKQMQEERRGNNQAGKRVNSADQSSTDAA